MHQDPNETKHVVVIGGGFAGLGLLKELAGNRRYRITLVDRNNYNYFTPLVYQVATSFLEPSSISYPFRKLIRKKSNVRFRLGTVLRISPHERTCYLDDGEIRYDILVLAIGTESNYFGREDIRRNAIPMKTLADALQMRNRLLKSLEEACQVKEGAERAKLLSVVVAGGGPTGVEVSGMIGEMKKSIIAKDYPELAGSAGDIYLVEGSDALLAQMERRSQVAAYNKLESLGVKILLSSMVKEYANDEVLLSTGQTISTKNLIWAAGVAGTVIEGLPAGSYGSGRRLLVDEYNRVSGFTDLFAMGDACLQTTDPSFPRGHPQLAQVAIQQGRRLGKNLAALAGGKPMQPFRYNNKGVMAIVGRNYAVADLTRPRLHIQHFPALVIWLFIHLLSLVTWGNKIRTLYNWTVAYLTSDQSLRMIIRPDEKAPPVM